MFVKEGSAIMSLLEALAQRAKERAPIEAQIVSEIKAGLAAPG